MSAVAVVAAVIALAAFLLNLVVFARTVKKERAAEDSAKSAKADAERALDAAEESAGAATRSAAAAEQSASAAERTAAAQTELAAIARLEAEDYAPPWRLERVSGGRCALHNDGRETELDIEISGECVFRGPALVERIPRDEMVEFSVYDVLGGDTVVTVRWSHPGNSERSAWRHHLPPRRR